MKIKNYVVAAAILGVSLFTACTPNSLEDNEEPQTIERKKFLVPRAG